MWNWWISVKEKMDKMEKIRETKRHYKKIKSKAKYDRHGNLKKVVTRKGGKRIVTKFKKKGIKHKATKTPKTRTKTVTRRGLKRRVKRS